jgi:hypothetical protein
MTEPRRDVVPAGFPQVVEEHPLSEATRQRVAAIIRAIDIVRLDAQRVTQVLPHEVEEAADKHPWTPSTALAGVVGGTVGAAVGLAIGAYGSGTLILAGPLGLAIGGALGVLLFRGRNYRRLERATQKAGRAIGLVKTELNALPAHAPAEVRMKLHEQYSALITRYSEIARESFDDGSMWRRSPDSFRSDDH